MLADRLHVRDVRSTTPFRLSLLFGALLLGGIAAALAFSYVLTARELIARSDLIMKAQAARILSVPAAQLPDRVRGEIADSTPGLNYFALIGQDGTPVLGNIRLLMQIPFDRAFDVAAVPGVHGPIRVLRLRAPTGETLLVARDTTQITDLRRHLLLILFASGVGSAMLAIAAALLLSIAPLRRVRDLQRASRAIAAGDLAVRMPIAGRHDELDQFAGTVNLMVEEVVRVIAQVKTATDAIAHDLRTPLTRVRGALHRLAKDAAVPPVQAAIVRTAVANLDAMIERFAALLRISELEASGRRSGLASMALLPLLDEVGELYQPLAEDSGVTLTIERDRDFTIEADRDLLFEALGNLVDNAVKFARHHVTVRLETAPGGAAIAVIDDGPGIPVEERDAVVRRFYRAPGAAKIRGTGLGLSIVQAILHLHGFALELDDADPGLVVRIRFPASR